MITRRNKVAKHVVEWATNGRSSRNKNAKKVMPLLTATHCAVNMKCATIES